MTFPPLPTCLSALALLPLPAFAAPSDRLPEVLVDATPLDGEITPAVGWDEEALERVSPVTLDALLAEHPSFSLFRRQSASFGNPTSAGVSLRKVGASAASRSLVLLDGVPQNDPFGSWINWARYSPTLLGTAEITRGYAATSFGNLSAAGTVSLRSRDIKPGSGTLSLTGGSHGLRGGALHYDFGGLDWRGSLGLFQQRQDGFYVLSSDELGPIDRRLSRQHEGAELRLHFDLRDHLRLETRLSAFDEIRSNGTALTGNTTGAQDASVHLKAESWNALLYYQNRRFTSRFSAAAAARVTERLALDQFDVPGKGLGGSWTSNDDWRDFSLVSGVDFRLLEGETNEVAGSFRRRRAGGEQGLYGAFLRAIHDSDLGRLSASLRLDHWRLSNGVRRETRPSNGSLLRNDRLPDRSGWEPTGSLIWQQDLQEDLEWTLAASRSFRLPTINELYRPFRVRSDITEANPSLEPEIFETLETSLSHQGENWSASLAFFHHWIHDAITNVPQDEPASTGGLQRQRNNVRQARVAGTSLDLTWQPSPRWQLLARALWTRSRFTESRVQPRLKGNRFPQNSDFHSHLSARWQAHESFSTSFSASYRSSAFEDELGLSSLPAYWDLSAQAAWQIDEEISLQLHLENLLDEEIITGRGGGLNTLGQPRAFWLTTQWHF